MKYSTMLFMAVFLLLLFLPANFSYAQEITLTRATEPPQGEVVLGSQETTFRYRADAAPRAFNIRKVTRTINGTILQPGQVFSLSTTIGPRTRENGWRDAHMIISGHMENKPGGGVCQTASTLYAASVRAGLTILETRPHSRYLQYIEPGLDSTIAGDSYDLVVRNDFPFAVVLEARENFPGHLHYAWHGIRRMYDVRIDTTELSRREHRTVYVINRAYHPGRGHAREPGTDALVISQTITYTPLAGIMMPSRTSTRTIHYEASTRIMEWNPAIHHRR